jgi:osmotically inducible protein OsmC
MAFASTLAKNGFKPDLIETRAICSLESKPEGGWNIASMQLMVLAKIPDISTEKFDELAALAERNCPVSNLLRSGLKIELEANLA